MRICSICHRCYGDAFESCEDSGHPGMLESRQTSREVVEGYLLDTLSESESAFETYRSHHVASDQTCFIKLIRDGSESERFLREASTAIGLFHPNIAVVYDAGVAQNGDLFVVTENIAGQSLRDLLQSVGTPQLLTTVQIVRQTAEALHVMHEAGLTHGALRPENIFLATDLEHRLQVRLQNPDLGRVINRSILSDKFSIDLALERIRYFAPEQFLGSPANVHSDVYSLGVVFYEMLAGAPPFEAATATELIAMHRDQAPPDIKVNDFDLRMLLTHSLTESLRKRPEMRQRSANVFARQLRHIEQLGTHSPTPPPVMAAEQPVRTFAASVSSTRLPEPYLAPVNVSDEPTAREPIIAERSITMASESIEAKHLIPEPVKPIEPMRISSPETEAPAPSGLPKKIEWELLEDDIPSELEVAAVLSQEPIHSTNPDPLPSYIPPIVYQNAGPVDSEYIDDAWLVPNLESSATVDEPQQLEVEEAEEVTIVRSSPIRVEWDSPRHRSHNVMNSVVPNDIGFYPTLLGADETNKSETTASADSIFGAFDPLRVSPRFQVRPWMVGGGFLFLMLLFVFASGLLSDDRSSTSVSTVVEPVTTNAPVQPVASANENDVTARSKVPDKASDRLKDDSPREFELVHVSDNDRASQTSKNTKSTQPVKNEKDPILKTPAPNEKSRSTPAVPSTVVITAKNGKVASRVEPSTAKLVKKRPSTDTSKALTRPRIVANPQP
jgi:serine/threonine protein kinase